MNSLKFLKEVVLFLEKNKITTWVFGGWAEEMIGLCTPRKHKDIDLLYPAINFRKVDRLLSDNRNLEEIKGKHFHHKRAFLYDGIMVELFLLQKNKGRHYTNFWGSKKYYWPHDTLDNQDNPGVASKLALLDYRKNYDSLRKGANVK